MHIRSQNVIVNVNICDIHRIYESKGLYFYKVNVNNSPKLLNQMIKMTQSRLHAAQNALAKLHEHRGNTFYPHFHLAPPAGWMNDQTA